VSYNSLHKCLIDDKLWATLSFILLGWYLSPLFYHTFYVPIYDNLDSNVVWFKILAESGMIFSDSNATIPNMMNGLPRSSYGSEFNLLLWLYYFFEPKTAYIINEISIHLIAFFSMFIFLQRHIVPKNTFYNNTPIFIGAIYFSLIPMWSGAGANIAFLPLITYSLLNIKNNIDSKWDWITLLLIPFYSSFIFLYMHYIVLAGIYLFYDAFKNRALNKKLFFAIFIFGSIFLLKEYRLIYVTYIHPFFTSHRTEFDIFFSADMLECYRLSLVNFLIGHQPHATALHTDYILPVILIAIFLSFIHRRLNDKESLIVWVLIILSFFINIWPILLIHKLTLPSIALVSLLSIIILKKRKNNSALPQLMVFIIILSMLASIFEYQGLHRIIDLFPILQKINMVRFIFVAPLIWTMLLIYAIIVFYRKVNFTVLVVFILILFQFLLSEKNSFYRIDPKNGFASFEQYYAPKLFKNLKKNFLLNPKDNHIICFGIEPAVVQYNNLWTTGGYSVNYPLSYKHKFKKIFEGNYDKKEVNQNYDKWGSKVYLMTIPSQLQYFQRGLEVSSLRFNTKALCDLNTTLLLTPYFLKNPQSKYLSLQYKLKGEKDSWDIFVYKIDCSVSNTYPKEEKRKIQ